MAHVNYKFLHLKKQDERHIHLVWMFYTFMLYCLLFDKDWYKINTHHDKVHNRLSLATFDPVLRLLKCIGIFSNLLGTLLLGQNTYHFSNSCASPYTIGYQSLIINDLATYRTTTKVTRSYPNMHIIQHLNINIFTHT